MSKGPQGEKILFEIVMDYAERRGMKSAIEARAAYLALPDEPEQGKRDLPELSTITEALKTAEELIDRLEDEIYMMSQRRLVEVAGNESDTCTEATMRIL